jgi:hypothetical protein
LFHQNNNKRIGVFSCTVVALIAAVLTSVSVAQKTPDDQRGTEKTRPLVGRVLADVSTLTFGAGLGPRYTSFIFGVEEGGSARVVPVKVSYAFFKSDGPPPDSFFDYSKRYELQTLRDTKCDETLNSLSYVKNLDQSGKPLQPTYVLRFLEGAPKDLLKSDTILPCYTLRPGKYKVLSQDAERKSGSVSPNGDAEPTTTTH